MHLMARYFIGAGVAIAVAAIVMSSPAPVPSSDTTAGAAAAPTDGRRDRVASQAADQGHPNGPPGHRGRDRLEPGREDVVRGLIGLLLLQSK